MTTKKQIGKAVGPAARRQTWVQTERAAHESWAKLIASAPMAARLAHVLVSHMDASGAVVASQATLGELLAEPGKTPVHRNTVRRAIQRLEADRWIEVIELGGKGGALAYVVNSRVAWADRRDNLRLARFSAQVIASASEQTLSIDDRPPLRQVPVLLRGEHQLPSGPGDDPPSQPSLRGFEPDLPAVMRDEQGRQWEVDQQTGELQGVISDD